MADHGEVFTPPWIVDAMLDLVKGESERIESRFLESACGSGNFLVPVLTNGVEITPGWWEPEPLVIPRQVVQPTLQCPGCPTNR